MPEAVGPFHHIKELSRPMISSRGLAKVTNIVFRSYPNPGKRLKKLKLRLVHLQGSEQRV
jgi:hypothetical protein